MALNFKLLGQKQLERLIRKYGYKNVIRATKQQLNYHTVIIVSEIKSEDLSGPTGRTTVSPRSGHLRRSIKAKRVKMVGTSLVAGVNVGTAYAGVHIGRRGKKTVIRPKSGRYLTIPLDDAKTKSGVARGSARSAVFGDTFVMKSKKGNLLIMGKRRFQKGKRAGQTHGDIVPLFLLKKKVVVRARVDPSKHVKYVRQIISRDIIKELARG